MFKKTTTVMLILVLVISYTGAAFAMIGDENALDNNFEGDILAEKNQEGQLFEVIGLGTLASAPGTLPISGPFAAILAGTGSVSLGLAQIADPKNAIWENWPTGRWTFEHAPPDGGWGFASMSNKATASVCDMLANLIFSVTKSLTRLSINICVLAFHTDIVSGMVGWVSEGVKTIFNPEGDLSWLLITWGTIFLLIYAVYWFIRRELASIISALIIAVMAVGGVFFFAANAEPLIGNFARATDSVTGVFLGAVGNYTNAEQNVSEVNDPVDRGLVAFGQSAWSAIVADPWAVALFGTANEEDLKLTESEYKLMDKENFADQSNLKPGMRIDTLYLGTVAACRDDVVEILARPDVTSFKTIISGEGTAEVKHGDHSGTMVGLAASSASNHIVVAMLTLLPAVALFFLAATVGLSILVCQIMLAGMLLVLPIFLFVLMAPVKGWSLASKYFRSLLGFFMVKMIYGLYLSLVLTIGTAFVKAVMA
ncbi:hypothetical protein [Desulfolucanica intricata]|uniref:hypothetical protein n=1 Tax=Desulfolucanica intricata TaxID=1285191 RepID=UPI00082F2FDD|nr:hypothetical protein [Desulfolucanica intricata]